MYLFAESCCTDNNYVKVGGLFADKKNVHMYIKGPLCAGTRMKGGRKKFCAGQPAIAKAHICKWGV